MDLHYESTSKTMKLDFYLWKSKVDSNYYLKYHEVKYSNPNPYQSDPVTYTQSIPPENVKKEHLLKINTTDDFIKSLKTALDSYYRGARPKTGEDEKL
ncbi:MAG: hypothetical protein LBD11_04245 [Candidatus Peribacteria bacterium]|nr:hypothetical protein [Candidatus Peribacteria bacterium]